MDNDGVMRGGWWWWWAQDDDDGTQLTKTSGLKHPALDLSLTVVSCSRILYQCINNATMSLYTINIDRICVTVKEYLAETMRYDQPYSS